MKRIIPLKWKTFYLCLQAAGRVRPEKGQGQQGKTNTQRVGADFVIVPLALQTIGEADTKSNRPNKSQTVSMRLFTCYLHTEGQFDKKLNRQKMQVAF